MGVDFEANFGLGYKIERPIDEEDANTYRQTLDGIIEDMYDFSEYVKKSSKYVICEVGDTYDNESEWYIFIKYPFEHGFDLTTDVKKLDEYCESMDIKTIGHFGCLGGLLIS